MSAIPMLLWCPKCGARHVDSGEFATKEHHTHACQHCGVTWRPSIGPTVGVSFLPGFKDAATGYELFPVGSLHRVAIDVYRYATSRAENDPIPLVVLEQLKAIIEKEQRLPE